MKLELKAVLDVGLKDFLNLLVNSSSDCSYSIFAAKEFDYKATYVVRLTFLRLNRKALSDS